VLVDAPCTGLGTIHRRPELALRLEPSDPARLGELQRAILVNAAKLVKEGGLLALVTCSVAREEGIALEDAVAAEPSFEQIGPWLGEELDAYQILVWRP
jgi:16S rRNA (cytosine967-C5)-methyltransferase